jgi:hypothetical protein
VGSSRRSPVSSATSARRATSPAWTSAPSATAASTATQACARRAQRSTTASSRPSSFWAWCCSTSWPRVSRHAAAAARSGSSSPLRPADAARAQSRRSRAGSARCEFSSLSSPLRYCPARVPETPRCSEVRCGGRLQVYITFFNLQWPFELRKLMEVIKFFNLNIDLVQVPSAFCEGSPRRGSRALPSTYRSARMHGVLHHRTVLPVGASQPRRCRLRAVHHGHHVRCATATAVAPLPARVRALTNRSSSTHGGH